MAHAIVRLDRVTGTGDESKLLSARYFTNTTPTDIDNGMVVHIENELINDNREVFKVTAPTASDTIKTVGLVASVELDTDTCCLVTDLKEFYNKSTGAPIRVYLLETGDLFSVTKEAISGLPVSASDAKGKYIKLGTTTQWVYSASADGAVATILDTEVKNGNTLYVIRVI